jgi:toxin ParE1/3/4
MEIKILPAAKSRIFEIWAYTRTQWSEEQADKYVTGLINAIERHASDRLRWKPVPSAELDGVFVFRQAHHLVFFRDFGGSCIGVISILHESMNIPARLLEDIG